MAVPLSLYGGGVAWTLFYDTIYAHQDKQDDAQIGVRSTALRFADRSKWYLGVFSAASASLWLTAGYLNQHSWLYYFGVALSAAHMVHTLRTVDLNRPQSCGLAFRRSQLAGWLLTAGIAADMAMSTPIYL
jgi:4-hydroxybenzoate polyprenyltransferase